MRLDPAVHTIATLLNCGMYLFKGCIIKNTVNHLIRVSVRRGCAESPGAFIFDDKLENILCADMGDLDNILKYKELYYKPKQLRL